MVVVQIIYTFVNILYKLVANEGMNLRVLIAYRHIFSAAFMLPLAFFFERKTLPKFTRKVLFQAFLCGLFGGSLMHNLYVESLALVSATFDSTMLNLVPAVTFVLAIFLRLERANLGSVAGKAKVLGTLIGIGGAMVPTFYKGAEIDVWSTHVNLMQLTASSHIGPPTTAAAATTTRVLGSMLAFATCLSYAVWLIIQAKMSNNFPWHYSSTALMSIMASIQSLVFALCMKTDWKEWRLGWNKRLVAVSYSGIVGSGVAWALTAWCVRLKGPLFASVFSPLLLVLVTLAGSLMLEEPLHLGSLLGATFIVCGLYTVLWGESKEKSEIAAEMMSSKDSNDPLEPVNIS